MAQEIDLMFGALSPRISEQLEKQGYTANSVKCARWQEHSRQITALSLAHFLTDGEAHKARKRLFKEICKYARPMEPTP